MISLRTPLRYVQLFALSFSLLLILHVNGSGLGKPGKPGFRPNNPNVSELATPSKSTYKKDEAFRTGQFYVSLEGTPEGTGTIKEPWDLATALSKTDVVGPGSTIWLRGGIYTGAFTSFLTGTATAPIIIRQYSSERVTIEADTALYTSAVTVNGPYTWLWGFEISRSNPARSSTSSLLFSQRLVTGVSLNAAHNKLINLVVHDMNVGIEIGSGAIDSEIYGCLVYNNGLSVKMHEHGVEPQKQIEATQVRDTLVFNNYGFGNDGFGVMDWKLSLCPDGLLRFNYRTKETYPRNPSERSGVFDNFMCDQTWNSLGTESKQVTLSPNHYESGRAHIFINNSDKQDNVSVSFSDSGMKPGDMYELKDVRSFFDEPVIKGVYDGNPVSIPMTRQRIAPSTATSSYVSHTPETSGVFVLKPGSAEATSSPDTVAPTLRLISPRRNTTVSGIVSITVDATDDTGVNRVEFYDNGLLLNTDTVSPYSVAWDTSTSVEGVHNLTVKAFDDAGNHQISVAKVKVHNVTAGGAPTATFIATPASVLPGLPSTLSWATVNVTSVTINQGIGAVALIGTRIVSPAQTTTYTLTATNSTSSVVKTATVTVTPDTIPPTVSIATPIIGSIVSGTTPVSALAVDNIGVVGVQFKLDGSSLGAEDLTSPYSLAWNSATVSNGSHTLTASARDAAGNTATSLPVSITVTNAVPSGNNITLNPSITYQTMRGWEAAARMLQDNYPTTYQNWQQAVINGAMDVGINRLRVEVQSGSENPIDYYQQYLNGTITESAWHVHRYDAVNDNSNPNSINMSGFHFTRVAKMFDAVIIPLRQRLAAQGESLYVSACVVDFSSGTFTKLHRNNPAEYGEFVLAFYQWMDATYGFKPDAWEVILEPDNAAWTAAHITDCVLAAQNRLLAAGITPNFVLASTASGPQAINFYNAIKARNPSALTYVSEVSYHRYGGGITNAQLTALSNTVRTDGKTTMMSELIGANYNTLHTDLTVGNNSSWTQFVLASDIANGDNGAHLFMINPSTNAVTYGSRTKFLRQYFKWVRRGAVRIGATSTHSSLTPAAFINTNGKYVVVVRATSGVPFNIVGLPAGTYGIKYTTGSQYNIDLPDKIITQSGTLSSSIPATGVITIYAK